MYCQADLFNIPEHICYLNTAYLSPNLKNVADAGVSAIHKKNLPYTLNPDDFFSGGEIIKNQFSRLIDSPYPERMAIIPSVSYGLANAANNIPHKDQGEILLLDEEFPSNVYVWQRLAKKKSYKIRFIQCSTNNGSWTENILKAIHEKTLVVSMSTVHWTNGYAFDLPSIRKKTSELGIPFILDGTQSIGALPFSLKECPVDALICAGYKWLFGPYGLGLAYYGPLFDQGVPIEENWINRMRSEDFSHLTDYSAEYRPGAFRYNVGESAQFFQMPMLSAALDQILKWSPESIQNYCRNLRDKLEKLLIENGFEGMTDFRYFPGHLFPINLSRLQWSPGALNNFLRANYIYVSVRGSYLRIAPHVYNHEAHLEQLVLSLAGARDQGAFK